MLRGNLRLCQLILFMTSRSMAPSTARLLIYPLTFPTHRDWRFMNLCFLIQAVHRPKAQSRESVCRRHRKRPTHAGSFSNQRTPHHQSTSPSPPSHPIQTCNGLDVRFFTTTSISSRKRGIPYVRPNSHAAQPSTPVPSAHPPLAPARYTPWGA